MLLDKIVELENDRSYVILDQTMFENNKYYYGLRLNSNEEPTNNYLFFEEIKDEEDIYLEPIHDEQLKGYLLTTFTVDFLNKVYDM